jgi:3-oxoacyl-[acyl-carrier protein] reductase
MLTSALSGALNNHLICNHLLAQELVPGMKNEGYGRIINIISTSVKEPIEGLGVSNTTRWAVAGWAKTLAGELGQFGITVNNVLPGYTHTARLDEIIVKESPHPDFQKKRSFKVCRTVYRQEDLPSQLEVAAAVAFRSTPAAS